MKKQRLVEKDYSRLSRTKGEEAKKGTSHHAGRSQVSVLDQFVQCGGKQETKERERLVRRWSEKSIQEELRRSGWKRGGNQVRKIVNRGKWERDRGLRARDHFGEKTDEKKTGMYTRIGVKAEFGKRHAKDREFQDRLFERKSRPKRRGRGRKENGQIKWLGEFQGVEKPRGEEGRFKRRGRRKGRISTELPKENTLMESLKDAYRRTRRKMRRSQMRRRSRVRVSQEKKRKVD